MNKSIERLNTIVVKRYGIGTENGEMGLVVGTCDAPTFCMVKPDGTQFHWRQDLTRPATTEEAIEYWKQRALQAERRVLSHAD